MTLFRRDWDTLRRGLSQEQPRRRAEGSGFRLFDGYAFTVSGYILMCPDFIM